MKVGEWARVKPIKRNVLIKKILEVGIQPHPYLKFEDGEGWFLSQLLDCKTSENLEDLLEVGDLIKYYYVNFKTNSQTIIGGNKALNAIKNDVNLNLIKLIKIIPHENLQWQEVDYEQTS